MYFANVQRLSCILFTWYYMLQCYLCLLMQLEFSHLFIVCFKQFVMVLGCVLFSFHSHVCIRNTEKEYLPKILYHKQ